MLTILVSWMIIFVLCLILGTGGLTLSYRLCGSGRTSPPALRPIPCFFAGVILATLYAEFMSLFTGLGSPVALAVPVLLMIPVFMNKGCRGALLQFGKSLLSLPLWKLILFLGILLILAFFTSRGPEHTDTSYYHAAAIHFLEDYGMIRGLGNLMGNFAYNSAWLPFCALFSFKSFFPLPLHGANGLLAAVLGLYAMERLTGWRHHPLHVADALSGASLFYLVVVACVLQSPATDQPAMLFALYILIRFAEETESHPQVSYDLIHTLGLLSIAAVYTASLKLSAAPLALIALAPAILLFRKKQWKPILLYLAGGILVILPFLIRNYFLSGYLVYPFPAVDIFSPDWKIPLEHTIIDSVQINMYGRALYELEYNKLSLREWLPLWWEAQENYGKLLILSVFASAAGWALTAFRKKLNKRRLNPYLAVLKLSCLACFLFWLLTAPDIRFALAFLLAIPASFLGEAIQPQKEGISSLLSGCLILFVLTCLFPFWNHYVTDDLLFIKRQAKEPYYLLPKDYERFDVHPENIGGVLFYRPGKDGKCGYYGFPACMTDPSLIELRGTELSEGVRPRTREAAEEASE